MFTDDLIRRALEEDIGQGDITSQALVPEGLSGHGVMVVKESATIAGLGVAGGVFSLLDPKIQLKQRVSDGARVEAGTPILEAHGAFGSLLAGERVALNFVQRLSGIATFTSKFVEKVKGTPVKILDTRKTTPVLRHLEKYAVRVGGGQNHRFGLSDGILIKDNHIVACGGSVSEAVKKMVARTQKKPIICEISREADVEPAISAGAHRLLLDNMDNATISKCVKLAKGRVKLEVSGGMTLDRVSEVARLGVDFISVGALTHSAPSVDMSFEVTSDAHH